MKKIFRMQAVMTAALLAMGAAYVARAENGGGGGGNGIRLEASLRGPAIHRIRPEGNGDFRVDSPGQLRLKIEVENVNLPTGTAVTFAIVHSGMSMNVGVRTLSDNGDAELELETQNGQPVPAVHRGDTATVSTSDGTIIAAGVFLPKNN